MSKKQTLKDYIDFKRTSIKHEGKIKDIERYIKKFLNVSKKEINKFEEKDLIKFINSISSHYSIASQNTIKPILKHFIKWKFEDYPVRFRNLDSLCKIQKAEATYQPEDMLTEKEIIKLANGERDLMWRTYWLIYFYGAFRPSEAVRLKRKEIKFEKDGTATLKVFLTKNKKNVYKSIPPHVVECLKEWLEKLEPTDDDYIFPSPLREGEHIKAKTGYFRMVALSKKVLGKKVVPYAIRHSFGSIKYNDDGLEKSHVAEQMGHNKNMEAVYKNLNGEQRITNVKKIWAKKDNLTISEKSELEALRKRMARIEKVMKLITGKLKMPKLDEMKDI